MCSKNDVSEAENVEGKWTVMEDVWLKASMWADKDHRTSMRPRDDEMKRQHMLWKRKCYKMRHKTEATSERNECKEA